VGKILGQAGFTYYRTGSLMPIAGIMQFDSADVASMVSAGIFADVVAHEMAHVMGFGTLWNPGFRGLNSTFGQYTGQQALNEYRLLSGNSSASYVPLETVGGSGTVNAHWAESVFGAELMTGYASSSGNMPLSRMTVASFADIGYQINYGVAEAYSLPGAVSAIRAIASGSDIEMAEIAAGDIYGVVSGTVGNDRLMGTAHNDYFSNLQGRDVIVTGSGSDQIVFSRIAPAGELDVITDFAPGTDTLVFDAAAFAALAPYAGAASVGSGNFLLGDHALDADDYLLYDATTQTLYYDADGSGAQLANPIATILPGDQPLSYVNFVVV
jgi:Ca2+-binding RTX toxin-like protein